MAEMRIILDQLQRPVVIKKPIQRIISLVPSITELLFEFELGNRIVGRTKFCVHPADTVDEVAIVGGTKNLRFDIIKTLQPDLIIANKEENNKSDIENLEEAFPVWVSDVPNVSASFDMILQLGDIFDITSKSNEIIQKCTHQIDKLKSEKNKRAIYLIWQNPYMTIGGDTYIHDMMQALGYENVFGQSQRYPQITIEEMRSHQPDVILFSSEPFPFTEKHIKELQKYLPTIDIRLVNGELFSWYGSRLLAL